MTRQPAFDYHARTAQAPTFPKMLRLNAREHARRGVVQRDLGRGT